MRMSHECSRIHASNANVYVLISDMMILMASGLSDRLILIHFGKLFIHVDDVFLWSVTLILVIENAAHAL